jgi:hypothetical protein
VSEMTELLGPDEYMKLSFIFQMKILFSQETQVVDRRQASWEIRNRLL